MDVVQRESPRALAEIPAEVQGDLTLASNSHRNNQGSYNTHTNSQTVNINLHGPVPDTLLPMLNNLVISPISPGEAFSRSVVMTASPSPAGDQSAEISEVVQTPTQIRFSTSETPSASMTLADASESEHEEGDVGDYVPDIDVCIKLVELNAKNVALPNATSLFARRYVTTAIYENNQSISIWEPNPREMPKEDDLGYAIYAGDIGRFDETGSFRTYFNITFDSKMNKRLGYNTPKNFRPFRSPDPENPVLSYGRYSGSRFYAKGFKITRQNGGKTYKVEPLPKSVGVACITQESRRVYVGITQYHWGRLEKYISRYISDWEDKFAAGNYFKGNYQQLVLIGRSYRSSGFGSASSESLDSPIKSMSATLDFQQHPPLWDSDTFTKEASFNAIDMFDWSEEAKRKDRFGRHSPGYCLAVDALAIVRKTPGRFSRITSKGKSSRASFTSQVSKVSRIFSR